MNKLSLVSSVTQTNQSENKQINCNWIHPESSGSQSIPAQHHQVGVGGRSVSSSAPRPLASGQSTLGQSTLGQSTLGQSTLGQLTFPSVYQESKEIDLSQKSGKYPTIGLEMKGQSKYLSTVPDAKVRPRSSPSITTRMTSKKLLIQQSSSHTLVQSKRSPTHQAKQPVKIISIQSPPPTLSVATTHHGSVFNFNHNNQIINSQLISNQLINSQVINNQLINPSVVNRKNCTTNLSNTNHILLPSTSNSFRAQSSPYIFSQAPLLTQSSSLNMGQSSPLNMGQSSPLNMGQSSLNMGQSSLNMGQSPDSSHGSFATALRKLATLPVSQVPNFNSTQAPSGCDQKKNGSSADHVYAPIHFSNPPHLESNVILNRLLSNTPSTPASTTTSNLSVRLLPPTYHTITNLSPSSALSLDQGIKSLSGSRNVSSSGIWRPQESVFSNDSSADQKSSAEQKFSAEQKSSAENANQGTKRKVTENNSPRMPRNKKVKSNEMMVNVEVTPGHDAQTVVGERDAQTVVREKAPKSLMDARVDRLREYNDWKEKARIDGVIHARSTTTDAQRLMSTFTRDTKSASVKSESVNVTVTDTKSASVKSESINVTIIEDDDLVTDAETEIDEEDYDQMDQDIFLFSPTPLDLSDDDDDDGTCFKKPSLIDHQLVISNAFQEIDSKYSKPDFLSGINLIPVSAKFDHKFDTFVKKQRILFETPLPLHYEFIGKESGNDDAAISLACQDNVSTMQVVDANGNELIPSEIDCDQHKESFFKSILDLHFIGSTASAEKLKMNEIYWINHLDRISRKLGSADWRLKNNLGEECIKRWFENLDQINLNAKSKDGADARGEESQMAPSANIQVSDEVRVVPSGQSFTRLQSDAQVLKLQLIQFKEKLSYFNSSSIDNNIDKNSQVIIARQLEDNLNNLLHSIDSMFV